nr:pyridoxal-phosphate dependent enzyme [Ardenticatena sp.]
MLTLRCTTCHASAPPTAWRCPACGGVLDLLLPTFQPDAIESHEASLWRYAASLPVKRTVSLGEGFTPLVPLSHTPDPRVMAKLEFAMPTGSFKDRGTAISINVLLQNGVREVVEDSSGNAGASLAAYAAAAGIRARIFTPAHAAEGKKQQMRIFGADVVEVPGPRRAASEACLRAAEEHVYASHAWSPLHLVGLMTCAWELWEQLGDAPTAIVCPVGQGGLFLGLWRGFQALRAAGCITRMPRMFAVQSTACAPITTAWYLKEPDPIQVIEGTTIAEGIRIAQPIRGREVLGAIRSSGGAAFAVSDEAIRAAHKWLARRGLFVEPTSAVVGVPLEEVCERTREDGAIVLMLTGSGLKYGIT